MLVSVIIPNYNHGPFLSERIESILNQSFRELEVIILDDCSTDNSREVIERYRSDARVKHIVFNESNSGSVYLQWKKGIALAEGDLIWIAESDDYCELSLLEELTGFFRKYDKLSVAFVQSLVFDSNKKIVWKSESEYLEQRLDSRSFLEQHMLGANNMINASAVLFRKDAFLKISDDFTKYKQCGDWQFWCEIAGQGDVLISGKYLNYFRKHHANTTSRNWKEGMYYLEGTEVINYLIEKYGFSDNVIREQVGKMLVLLNKERDSYGKELYERLLQKVISIRPALIQNMQTGLVRRRNIEHVKSIIKSAIHK